MCIGAQIEINKLEWSKLKSISADQRRTQNTSARFQFRSAPAVLLSNFPINPSAISDRGSISQAAARKLVVSCAARGVSWLEKRGRAPEWILFWRVYQPHQ